MRRSPLVFAFAILFFSAVSFAGLWQDGMKKLEGVVTELLPIAISDQDFRSKKNEKKILRSLDELVSLSHKISGKKIKKNLPDQDPSLQFVSTLLLENVKRAKREFTRKNYRYSQHLVKNVTQYCIACHTRSTSGPRFDFKKLDQKVKKMGRFERAELFAASRQFDRALDAYEAVLSDRKFLKESRLDWEHAVYHSLAISVRVKNDPNRSLAIAERVIATPQAALFLKQDALKWKESIRTWKKELKRRPGTSAGLLAEARLLLSRGLKFQEYPMDRAANIYLLRTTAVAHRLMEKKGVTPSQMSEAFLIAGMAYEVLGQTTLWPLYEYYYEACIRRDPKGKSASLCFEKYQQSIHVGYSGSGGTSIPQGVQNHLNELQKLIE